MTEERKCLEGCGRTLGGNNRSGICTPCQVGPSKAQTPPKALAVRKPPASKAKGDAVARFKVVFDALGFDGEAMLEQYAQSMLDTLHAKADALPVPVALRAERRLPPEPVRLPAARAVGDRPTSETNPGD